MMYIVIGAHGFLGSYVLKHILQETEENILATSRKVIDNNSIKRIKWIQCDICKYDDIMNLYDNSIRENDVKIIYLAAFHHPDQVMNNQLKAWEVNIVSLSNFLKIFYGVNHFYYASTEVVYGENTSDVPFDEHASLRPISLYGKLKMAAEAITLAAGGNVVRFPVLMGPSLVQGKKHFYDAIIESAAQGVPIQAFTDQVRSFLDFDSAARVLVNLMEKPLARKEKIVNISGDKPLSKYDIVRRIVKHHGFSESLVLPVPMDANGVFHERRAKITILDNSLVKQLLHLPSLHMEV